MAFKLTEKGKDLVRKKLLENKSKKNYELETVISKINFLLWRWYPSNATFTLNTIRTLFDVSTVSRSSASIYLRIVRELEILQKIPGTRPEKLSLNTDSDLIIERPENQSQLEILPDAKSQPPSSLFLQAGASLKPVSTLIPKNMETRNNNTSNQKPTLTSSQVNTVKPSYTLISRKTFTDKSNFHKTTLEWFKNSFKISSSVKTFLTDPKEFLSEYDYSLALARFYGFLHNNWNDKDNECRLETQKEAEIYIQKLRNEFPLNFSCPDKINIHIVATLPEKITDRQYRNTLILTVNYDHTKLHVEKQTPNTLYFVDNDGWRSEITSIPLQELHDYLVYKRGIHLVPTQEQQQCIQLSPQEITALLDSAKKNQLQPEPKRMRFL